MPAKVGLESFEETCQVFDPKSSVNVEDELPGGAGSHHRLDRFGFRRVPRYAQKSTSAGLVRLGSHTLASWSATQNVVGLSSGEAEFYSLVKGATIGVGLQSMMKDVGVSVSMHVKSDAIAGIGIDSRRGFGKVRHIDVTQSWGSGEGSGRDHQSIKGRPEGEFGRCANNICFVR